MRRLWIACVLVGCAPTSILPAGSEVPALADDPLLLAQVDGADGVGRQVWLTHGFAGGEPVAYWDLGVVASDHAMPLYVLCRDEGTRCAPIAEHPHVAAALPGSTGYAPFGWIHEVAVTTSYAGQRLTSEAAIDEAVAAGLVARPEPTLSYVELAIVHPDTRVELGPEDWAPPNGTVYAEGVVAPAIDFTATHRRLPLLSASTGTIELRNVYSLRRDGEAMPIHERARGVDLTGDGDLSDSNNILGEALADLSYTPLWRPVSVTVPASYASIDTAMDETMADARASTDLFTIAPDYSITPIDGRVVSHEVSTLLVNCPIQSAPGAF